MSSDFFLAWRYLRYHKTRTLILIGCLSLIAAVPLALHRLLDEGQRQMTARAAATPLLIGARGSALDLSLNALYFNSPAPPAIPMSESTKVADSGWASPLPIHARFRVHGHPLVGVSLDYFDFRGLAVQTGETLGMLGDCVLGANAATELGLAPGDTLLTTPHNPFDFAGNYPLKLRVAGVFRKTHSPDDDAVFVDLQTVWVVEGLGHGHAGTAAAAQPPAFGVSDQAATQANVATYSEITPDNIGSFHFHGDPESYPITGLIAVPRDHRAATLLRGRYVDDASAVQLVLPEQTTQSLLDTVFRVGALFDAVVLLVGTAKLLALALVFALSLRLRQREIETIVLLGSGRGKVFRLIVAELVLLGCASALTCLITLRILHAYAGDLVRHFVIP
ncbi:MAG: hypothetical protein U1E83_08455 [Methylotetracoccus sp.]